MDHCRKNNNNNKQDRMENEIALADEVIENEMDREVKTYYYFFFWRNERLRLKIDTMKHVFIYIYFFMPCKVVIKQIWS